MSLPMSESGNGDIPRPQNEPEFSIEDTVRQQIMRVSHRWFYEALERERATGDTYYEDGSQDVGIDDVSRILLTRSGIKPHYYEMDRTEHIWLYFPLLEPEHLTRYDASPIIWIMDSSMDGERLLLSVASSQIAPTTPVSLESPKDMARMKWFQRVNPTPSKRVVQELNSLESLRRRRARIEDYQLTKLYSRAV